MIILLISECGADPNYINSIIRYTELLQAGLGGHTSTMLVLIESGSDVNITVFPRIVRIGTNNG